MNGTSPFRNLTNTSQYMEKSSLENLQEVADGLNELNDRITYVGGAVTGLYTTDDAVADAPATKDVDCVVEYFSLQEREEFEALLRAKHFHEDTESGVICRWIYKDIEVDIMPTDEKFYSFANRWYAPGVKSRQPYQLPNGRTIYIMSPMFFIATKLEAMSDRGGDDLRGSKDLEDVVYVLNACPDFMERFARETNDTLKKFIAEQFARLLQRPNIQEEIPCAMPSGDEDRADIIFAVLNGIGNQWRTCVL